MTLSQLSNTRDYVRRIYETLGRMRLGSSPDVSTTNIAPAPGWLYRTSARALNLMGYVGLKRECLHRAGAAQADASTLPAEGQLNPLLAGSPSNHGYRIVDRHLVPGFELYERLRLVTRVYPHPLHSLLDIGCCRGFYVLDAAWRFHCPKAVGIDVHEPYISAALAAAEHVQTPAASFHFASLEEVSDNPERFGGPFQVVLLLGTYHYLFWGSAACSTAYRSHEEILRRLASVCTDRLIFSGRLTMDRLPRYIKERLTSSDRDLPYTMEAFLQKAEAFFHIRHAGYLGTYPLLVMTKKRP